MALKAKSLFLYGFDITANNKSLDFVAVSGGPTLLATLNIGTYTLTGLMGEIKRALESADPAHKYTVTADRSFSSGTQNRISLSTNGVFLSLLFGSGPRSASSISSLIGFAATDRTGATSYQGVGSAGTALVTDYVAYTYLGSGMKRKVFGALNITASGQKEAIVFQVQKFFQAKFQYEPELKVLTEWTNLMTWMIEQKVLEFTPEITSPSVFYECTLESTEADGKGMAYNMTEMLPDFPFLYSTGMLTFRQKV
jgi:hypothetical protein